MKKSEDRIQQECYMYFWNTYPKLRKLLFAVPNGGYRIPSEAKKFQKTGVVAGVSDMIFLYRGNAWLFELKTDTGRQSKEQKEWQELVENQGFKYFLIRNVDSFKDILSHIIGN